MKLDGEKKQKEKQKCIYFDCFVMSICAAIVSVLSLK